MNRLIRFYNQNRKLFWLIVITIIGVIAFIQTLNNNYKNAEEKSSGTKNTTTYNTINTPAITGDSLDEKESIGVTKVIDNFITFCNNKEIEKAYNLLSKDCKQELYPNISSFETNYCNKIFNEYKLYDIKAWITTANSVTYKVQITEDILATGSTSNMNIEDYYTIVKEENEYKLNINKYIGKQSVNKSKTAQNITFDVIEKYVYIDYEIYKINVKNNTNKKIMIDGKQNTRTVNVLDQNELKYVAFLNEIIENDLLVLPTLSKEIKIKFNKTYNPNYIDTYMEFSNIILDVNNIENKTSIKIEL